MRDDRSAHFGPIEPETATKMHIFTRKSISNHGRRDTSFSIMDIIAANFRLNNGYLPRHGDDIICFVRFCDILRCDNDFYRPHGGTQLNG